MMRTTRYTHPSGRRRLVAVAGGLAVATAITLSGCSSPEPTESPAEAGDVELTFMNQSRGQEAALTQLA